MRDTARVRPEPACSRRAGGGNGPEDGDHGRVATRGSLGGRAVRGVGGGGVPPLSDLPGDLLPVSTPLSGGGHGGPRGPVPPTEGLTGSHLCRAGGRDLWDASGSSPVGARRIHTELVRAGRSAPAVSTIHQALRRNHLVADQPPRRPKALLRFEREIANDLWQIDATEVRLADQHKAYVLDVIDDHSRYLLAAVAADGP